MSTLSPVSIDDIFQLSHMGSLERAVGNNLYGIDHSQSPGAVPSNRDQQGFIFIVRPQLNLQGDNVRNMRKFMSLLEESTDASIHRYVRATLDPRLMAGYTFNKSSIAPMVCPLVDNQQAFVPVLTNNALTSSGWPDITTPTFDSRPGRLNEVYSMVDGLTDNYEGQTIDVSFRNTISDPILYMFYVWQHYSSAVFKGDLVPYPDFISEVRLDYTTRIYRVLLDRNRRYVTKIMSTGGAIPIASSVGQFGDFNIEQVFSDQNKEITMRFKVTGVEVFDPILVKEFNDTVGIFCPGMRDANRANSMTLIPHSLRQAFRNRGYPRIDPATYEMQWWASSELFTARSRVYLQALSALDSSAGSSVQTTGITTI